MNKALSTILSNYDMNITTIRNRLAVAPMTRVSATADGMPTSTMRDYYARFSKGGYGLVITEGLYVDKSHSQGYLYQPGMADDAQALAWAELTEESRQNGAVMFAQLMHAGALSQGNPFSDFTIAPSAIRPVGKQMTFYFGQGDYAEPAAMDELQISEVIRSFAQAAARAVHVGGFHGIEIHGANGYLLDQFLTAHTNQRTDNWGGDVHGRLRLLADVLRAVKAEVGSVIPVGVRISQGKVNDFGSKWPGREKDAAVIFTTLGEAGADFIHVTEFEAWQPAFDSGPATLVTLARRYAPGVTIIANGSLHEAERSVEAIENGADIVALGRGALANPDLPLLLVKGVEPRSFDNQILGPIANIKDSELRIV